VSRIGVTSAILLHESLCYVLVGCELRQPQICWFHNGLVWFVYWAMQMFCTAQLCCGKSSVRPSVCDVGAEKHILRYIEACRQAYLPENQLIYTVQRGYCSDNFDPWWLIEDIEHWVLIQESRAVARKPSDAAYLYPPLFHLAFRDDPIGANRSFLPPVVKTIG